MKRIYLLIKISLIGLSLSLTTLRINATNLKIKIIDSETGKTAPARVLIKNANGESFFPENSVTLQIGKEIWFMSSGSSEISVGSNKVLLRVERGKEYERVKRNIDLSGKDSEEIKIVLKRWINMKERGYLSSENHLHRSVWDVAAMCAAEDLDFGTSLQWWNYPRFGVPNGDGNVQDLPFDGISTLITAFDVEVEEAWGALYMIDMPNPFPFLNDKKRPNLIAAQYGKERGALNCYQGGWSREVLIDALLGYVDVVNVCNNNFHMHRYQPRSLYSNLLNVKGLPEYPNTPEGMMQMNTDTYYRLLNCGLKLAAGAGSATGAKETPVGFNRAYVRSSSDGSLKGSFEALKEGKNFVTNGPMLFLRTSEGLQPGDSLNMAGSKSITMEIEAISDSPLGVVDIVVNGEVVKSFPTDKNQKMFKGSFTLDVSESSWICARCTDTDMLLNNEELEEYRSPRINLFQDPNRFRYAHTSPIYFYLNGEGIAVRESVEEGLKMIDAFAKFAQENSSEKYFDTILSATEKAKEILINRLK
ncbi:MAG: CehA/McbA family metallohydrolase [Cyclobacteriaceae bacterium]|nr:CehA/McbA family metallohydrolase [Cyclobacteriaceae bacterium]